MIDRLLLLRCIDMLRATPRRRPRGDGGLRHRRGEPGRSRLRRRARAAAERRPHARRGAGAGARPRGARPAERRRRRPPARARRALLPAPARPAAARCGRALRAAGFAFVLLEAGRFALDAASASAIRRCSSCSGSSAPPGRRSWSAAAAARRAPANGRYAGGGRRLRPRPAERRLRRATGFTAAGPRLHRPPRGRGRNLSRAVLAPVLAARGPISIMPLPAIPLIHGLREIARGYDALIVDLWGVIHGGVEPYPGVLDALTALRAEGCRWHCSRTRRGARRPRSAG